MLRHGAGVDAPGPRARCINTGVDPAIELVPDRRQQPGVPKLSAECREIDAALSELLITATICR